MHSTVELVSYLCMPCSRMGPGHIQWIEERPVALLGKSRQAFSEVKSESRCLIKTLSLACAGK